MMKVDASEALSMADGNNVFNIEQEQDETKGYFKEFWQSFNLIYLKHKWFDENYWKLAFCSSSFDFINKYPNLILIYRTLLFLLTIFNLIHGIVITRPVQEWPIYYTHLTLLITFLAILFQFLITYRVNFYRGNDIVPRHSLQYIHLILIVISLGSGLAVSLLYWTVIHNPLTWLYYPKLILDHGIIWFLLLIDISIFTRLPIYMIDCILLISFAMIYGLFTLGIFVLKSKFSHDRVGYVYRVFNLNNPSIWMLMQVFLFIFFVPFGIMFILWNLFRLRRSIHVKITTDEREELDSNVTI